MLYAHYRTPHLRTVQNIFTVNLGVTDLCTTVVVLPVWIRTTLGGAASTLTGATRADALTAGATGGCRRGLLDPRRRGLHPYRGRDRGHRRGLSPWSPRLYAGSRASSPWSCSPSPSPPSPVSPSTGTSVSATPFSTRLRSPPGGCTSWWGTCGCRGSSRQGRPSPAGAGTLTAPCVCLSVCRTGVRIRLTPSSCSLWHYSYHSSSWFIPTRKSCR